MGSTLDSVTLAWDESTDDVGICDYVIYNNQQYFDRTPLTHYTAVDLPSGTYSFEVCALDLSGNHSAPASVSVEIEGEL
jgi:predicted phage tail protein